MVRFTHTKMRYSVKEACHILSIGRTRIYDLFKEGRLEYVMDGRNRFVPAWALDAYMASN